MRSLLELISNHSRDNSIMPIIAIAAIVVILVLYVVVKIKWVKYALTSGIILIGAVMMYQGYSNMLQPAGLQMIITATKVLTFGIVGFMFSVILDIIDSLANIFKQNKKKQEKPIVNDETKVVELNDGNQVTDETKVIETKPEVNEETKIIKMKPKVTDKTKVISKKPKVNDETKLIKKTKASADEVVDETKTINITDVRNIDRPNKDK